MICGSTMHARPMPRRRRSPSAAPHRLVYPVEANEIFLNVSADEAERLRAQGFDFYDWGPGEIRLVTSWDQQGEESIGSPRQSRTVTAISEAYQLGRALIGRTRPTATSDQKPRDLPRLS